MFNCPALELSLRLPLSSHLSLPRCFDSIHMLPLPPPTRLITFCNRLVRLIRRLGRRCGGGRIRS